MAETTSSTSVAAEPASLFSHFLSLELGRQLGLMLGLASSVAIGVAVALWLVVEKDYRPLYASLDRIDSTSVVEVLEEANIDYRIDQRSGALLVASDQLYSAKLKLSSAGMPADRNVGFELLDQEQPLGTSQFMESARYRRGLEGELARTISSIAAVRTARVHLAIPKSAVFLRDKRAPRASVFIEAFQGRALDEDKVRAIANLVVSSVPELKLRNVTVVDQRGNLLSDFDSNPKYAEAARQLEYSRQIESHLLQRVNSLLIPILGGDKFRAEVAVDLDFTQLEQTAEIYNPDPAALRSEQTTHEQTYSDQPAEGVPGSLSNQPPEVAKLQGEGDTQVEDLPARQSRILETRNFEIDRTISHTRHPFGQVRRLTVAVAVDDLRSADPLADQLQPPVNWSSESLQQLAVLVQDAVGYDALRGDRVTVVNTPFLQSLSEPAPLPELPFWQGEAFHRCLRWCWQC